MSATGQRIRRAVDGFLDSILLFLDQYKDNECFKGLLVDAQLEATELLRIRNRLDLIDSLERPTAEDEQEVCHLQEVYGDLVPT